MKLEDHPTAKWYQEQSQAGVESLICPSQSNGGQGSQNYQRSYKSEVQFKDC